MSRFPRWSNLRLRTKLTLLIEAAILVLGVATGLLATMRARATLEAELTRRGLAIAHDLAMFSVRPLLANDLAALRRFVLHTATQDHVREVSVLGPDGAVLMHNDLAALGRRPSDAATGQALASEAAGVQALWPTQAEGPAYAIFVPIVSAGARLGTVVMEYSHSAAETEIATAGGRSPGSGSRRW
jgi:sensor histidine kinase regulating citrate/malate metabolism